MLKPLLRTFAVLGAAAVCLLPFVATSQPPANDGKVRLTVKLPADAVLTVDERPTTSTGPERKFESPVLPAGKKFTYHLKATWTENGKTRIRTSKVRVEAGTNYTVDLTKDNTVPTTDKKVIEDKKAPPIDKEVIEDKKAPPIDKKGAADKKKAPEDKNDIEDKKAPPIDKKGAVDKKGAANKKKAPGGQEGR